MIYFLTILLSGLGGFILHILTMKISFKQRTIDYKIKVYDSLIAHWVKMRNFIFSQTSVTPQVTQQFDQIYGESQSLVGEVFLISENNELAENINKINEDFYRSNWTQMSHQQINDKMENLKSIGISLIMEMREDIKASTRFDIKDFFHIISGFRK